MNQQKKRMSFFKGIGGSLLIWFLLLSIVPLTVISVLGYQNSYESLSESRVAALQSITKRAAKSITSLVENQLTTLEFQSKSKPNEVFLTGLRKDFEKSGQTIEEFLN